MFSHTRELAVQISNQFSRLGKYLPDITVKTVYGGIPIKKSIDLVKSGCDILIGTPGRIADLVRRKALNVSKIQYFVVDECDHQLEVLSCPNWFSLIYRHTEGYPGSFPGYSVR